MINNNQLLIIGTGVVIILAVIIFICIRSKKHPGSKSNYSNPRGLYSLYPLNRVDANPREYTSCKQNCRKANLPAITEFCVRQCGFSNDKNIVNKCILDCTSTWPQSSMAPQDTSSGNGGFGVENGVNAVCNAPCQKYTNSTNAS